MYVYSTFCYTVSTSSLQSEEGNTRVSLVELGPSTPKGDSKKLKPCAAKRSMSKTPIAVARTSKGKLHASTVQRNGYGRSTKLDFVTIDESADLRDYSLYLSSTTGLAKKESVVRADIANIGKLMSFADTFCL